MAETEKNAPPIGEEIAILTKDVDVTQGFIMQNPDTTLLGESRGKGLKLYDEVDRDAHAGSVLQTRYLSVAGEKWEVDAAGDSAKDKEIATFIQEALEDTNLLQAVQELMQAVLYGYYVGEVIWTENDKKIVADKILVKHPRRFAFSQERELRLITKTEPRDGEAVPERKFIPFSYGDSDNPYGKGLGQRLWWCVWFKKHGIKYWLIFLDKFGMPTGIGKYPAGSSEPDKKTLMEAIKAIHSETGVTIPETMAIELLEASRSGNVTYQSMCEYMDLQISKAVLGQTLTTEVSGGSYAASQTHDEVRQDIKEADAGLMAACLNATLIKWLVDFNYASVTDYPKFRYVTERKEVLKEQAERDEVLVNQIGVQVDDDYWYETYNLPAPKGGPKVIPPSTISTPTTPQFAERQQGPEQSILDELVNRHLISNHFQANEKEIVRIVKDSQSFEDAIEKLISFYPDMNASGIQTAVENIMINGHLLGRLSVQGEADDA